MTLPYENATSGGAALADLILRDWIKGQVMAVETGILTFEGAFLGQILLPDGRSVLEHAQASNLLALAGPEGAA